MDDGFINTLDKKHIAWHFYLKHMNQYIMTDSGKWYYVSKSGLWKNDLSLLCVISDFYHNEIRAREADLLITMRRTQQTIMPDAIKIELIEKFKETLKFYKTAYIKLGTSSFVKGIIRNLSILYRPIQLDSNTSIFAFSDCLYDFTTHDLRPITPNDMISISTGYRCPRDVPEQDIAEVKRYLFSIWENDAMVEFFLDVMASAMLGVNKFNRFWVLFGPTAGNSKTCVMSLMTNVFGKYATTLDVGLLMRKKSAKCTSAVWASVRGKRLVVTSEAGAPLHVSTVKLLTSNEPIECSRFQPQCIVMMHTNVIPTYKKGQGNADCQRIIPFPITFRPESQINPNNVMHRLGNFKITERCKSIEWRNAIMHLLLQRVKSIYEATELQEPDMVLNANE